jgi:hypothetical protein
MNFDLIKKTFKDIALEIAMTRLPYLSAQTVNVMSEPLPLEKAYYFTSEKGLFYVDKNGIEKRMSIPIYGLAFAHPHIFLSVQISTRSILFQGSLDALKSGGNLNLKKLYEIQTRSSNERIHQITYGSGYIWVANTGRNSILKVDAKTGEILEEIWPFLDSFGDPYVGDHNHINSVHGYNDFIIFTAYRAGGKSLIGLIHKDGSVTGYHYPNQGGHDIYLDEDNFYFCDTFGDHALGKGGRLITKDGPYAEDLFSRSPGYIVRGVAKNNNELIIGHSHKGERSKRFKGHGALLIWNKQQFQGEVKIPAAQIYQIIRACDGRNFDYDEDKIKIATVQFILKKQLGKPVYQSCCYRSL